MQLLNTLRTCSNMKGSPSVPYSAQNRCAINTSSDLLNIPLTLYPQPSYLLKHEGQSHHRHSMEGQRHLSCVMHDAKM
jgi:hypothetical protein